MMCDKEASTLWTAYKVKPYNCPNRFSNPEHSCCSFAKDSLYDGSGGCTDLCEDWSELANITRDEHEHHMETCWQITEILSLPWPTFTVLACLGRERISVICQQVSIWCSCSSLVMLA